MQHINQVAISELGCTILPAKPRFCQQHLLGIHKKTYELWFNTVQSALSEENNPELATNLTSDPFLEMDEVVVISHKNLPVGLFMFRWLDITHSMNLNQNSIINRFPDHLINKLLTHNTHRIMLMGQLAVDPNWRRSKVDLPLTDLLMGFAVTRFLESNAQVLLTTTRNNRSTNKLCYRQGGQKYADNNEVFGVSSDIVIFHPKDVVPLPNNKLVQLINYLWINRNSGWIDMPLNFIGRSNDQQVCHA